MVNDMDEKLGFEPICRECFDAKGYRNKISFDEFKIKIDSCIVCGKIKDCIDLANVPTIQNMRTVRELIEMLEKYDETLFVYAYEGEMIGLVIVDDGVNEVGTIELDPD
jgi:hypothetical protein